MGCGEAKGHVLGFVKFDKNASASFISEEWRPYCQIRRIALRVLQTSRGFWVFLFRQSSEWMRLRKSQYNGLTGQFCALATRQRNWSSNRKSKEAEQLRLIYYVERGAMSRPVNVKGNLDLSVASQISRSQYAKKSLRNTVSIYPGFSNSLENDFSCRRNRTRIRKLFRKTCLFVVFAVSFLPDLFHLWTVFHILLNRKVLTLSSVSRIAIHELDNKEFTQSHPYV